AKLVVCHPLATTPCHVLRAARSGSTWNHCGSYARANSTLSLSVIVSGPRVIERPGGRSANFIGPVDEERACRKATFFANVRASPRAAISEVSRSAYEDRSRRRGPGGTAVRLPGEAAGRRSTRASSSRIPPFPLRRRRLLLDRYRKD